MPALAPPKKILIVDDRSIDRDYFRTVLSYAGYEVLEAADGAAALELARRRHPDLVLTDAMMPKLDGYALVQALRGDPRLAATRTILCTAAYREDKARKLAATIGATRFLAKPLEPQELLAAVAAVLADPAPVAAPLLSPAEAEGAHLRLLNDELVAKTVRLEAEIAARQRAEETLRREKRLAEEASRAKGEFLAMMSHEIRTPLNAIMGVAQVLARSRLSAEQQHLVDTLRTAGRDLLGVIDDVLDMARIEAGRFQLECAPFSLGDLLEHLGDVLSGGAAAKGLSLAVEPLPAGIDVLVGDARRLSQVLYNLIGNAIKFTERGAVTVAVKVLERRGEAATLHFAVRDTGIGIAADKAGRIFDPFVQADVSTSRQFGGSGLGLAICKRLIDLMGGEIGVDSRPGAGSEFWFALPLRLEGALPPAAPPAAAAGGRRLNGVGILVVDDSAVNRDIARRLLEMEGARVALAEEGGRALASLRAAPAGYGLVLMDMQMPGLDGLEATRRIRADHALAGLPVVGLTAGALPCQREEALAAGMNDFIVKPFELDNMVEIVRRHLAEAPPADRAVVPGERGESFPELPGVDSRQAGQRLLGDRRLFLAGLRHLRDEFADVAERIRADLAQGERVAACRRLHKLHGSAGNLAANAIAGLAKGLEGAIAAGQDEQAAALLRNLEAALRELLAALPPLLAADFPAVEAVATAAADSPAAPKLLIVDDDPAAIGHLRRILADCGQVFFATGGEGALAQIRRHSPDLLLLDAEMPGMGGFDTCAAIKKDPDLADLPVIFITAHADSDAETLALAIGAVDFIPKPINPPVVLARVRTHLELKRQTDELRRLSSVDPLTGIANRRTFDEALEREWRRARRDGSPLSLLMIDVDFFKRYNDAYGHPAGDGCLRAVAGVLAGTAQRAGELAARYGGEEFVVLLPGADGAQALHHGRRICETVHALRLPHGHSDAAPYVTVSVGVASRLAPDSADTGHSGPESLVALADQALYLAKDAGRNRVADVVRALE